MDAALAPAPPFDLTFYPPRNGVLGRWAVVHEDGTLLFSAPDEQVARGRLMRLRAIVQPRLDAGIHISGADMLSLWPADAPGALVLSLEGAGALSSGARSSGDLSTDIARLGRTVGRLSAQAEAGEQAEDFGRLSSDGKSSRVRDLGQRLAREAGVDVEAASYATLDAYYRRASDLLRASTGDRRAIGRLASEDVPAPTRGRAGEPLDAVEYARARGPKYFADYQRAKAAGRI